MSSWGWPQWVMALLLLYNLVGNICIAVRDSQSTTEKLLQRAIDRKENWILVIAINSIFLALEWFILAKGGFFG